jgi:Kef-type K+ transport system membrane component KefB
MSTEEFQNLGLWVLRIAVYGTLLAIVLGIIYVTLKTINNNFKARRIIGVILTLVQLAIVVCILAFGYHFAKQEGWVEQIRAILP